MDTIVGECHFMVGEDRFAEMVDEDRFVEMVGEDHFAEEVPSVTRGCLRSCNGRSGAFQRNAKLTPEGGSWPRIIDLKCVETLRATRVFNRYRINDEGRV